MPENLIPRPDTNASQNDAEIARTQSEHKFAVSLGGGEVFGKYLKTAYLKGLINAACVISLETESEFKENHPDYDGMYFQTHDDTETIRLLENVIPQDKESIIAIETPTKARLPLALKILENPKFDNALLFIEKPYSDTLEEIAVWKDLIKKHPGRFHLSAKYMYGRVNTFIPELLLNVVPTSIDANIIEGWPYYKKVASQKKELGWHQYLSDKAALDIMFHYLTILVKAAERFGGFERFAIRKVSELYHHRADFEPDYGMKAELYLITKTARAIKTKINAGKGRGDSDRFIRVNYKLNELKFTVQQIYTTENADDPVTVIPTNREPDRAAIHPPGYSYFPVEWGEDILGKQSIEMQEALVQCAETCILITQLVDEEENRFRRNDSDKLHA